MSEPRTIANRYEIGDIIGQGGMGEVFRGLDTQTGERVAIKALKPEFMVDNPALVERFQREADALRQLNHPNIVKVLTSADEHNRRYIVLEYVGGGSLADLLRKHPQLPARRVVEIALDLADALTRAHRLKIIHRDIKPANVLLAEDGTPRLTDFGVAHLDDRSRVTETGTMLGTYAYISPEACYGLEMDERADIWSFGIVLYEMLTGVRPFDEGSPAATITAIMTRPLPDLSRIRPDVPPALVNLINVMLLKERDERIASVRLVGAELEAILRDMDTPQPVAADAAALESRFSPTTPPEVREALKQPAGGTPSPSPKPSDAPIAFATSERGEGFIILRNRPVTWLIGGLVVALLIVAFVLLAPDGRSRSQEEDTPPRAGMVIEPVQPGEYMVLVAQLEPLGVEPRDVTRFVVDNLQATLEEEVPFSRIRIRAYPEIVTSSEMALAAAEANGAAVVVWGNYNADFVQLDVQVGVTSAFPRLQISRDTLTRTANVRVRMADPLRESIAPAVLGVLSTLQGADGDGYEFMRSIAVLDAIEVESAEIVSGGVAGRMHHFFDLFLDDTEAAVEEISAAIALDAANPMPYVLRSIAAQRLLDMQDSLRDAETAARLGPADWTVPLYLMALTTSPEETLEYYNRIVELRPDDWFPVNFRGAMYYMLGEFDLAEADLQRAIELGPNANFPYVIASLIAMREGRIEDTVGYVETILAEFPDPGLLNRLMEATFGAQDNNTTSTLLITFGNITLGQHAEAVRVAGEAVAYYEALAEAGQVDLSQPIFAITVSDLYLLQGFGHCNLDEPEDAEAAYTRTIELAPEYSAAYLLRAEVRLRQGDRAGAEEDFDTIRAGDQADALEPLIESLQAGELSCDNFFIAPAE